MGSITTQYFQHFSLQGGTTFYLSHVWQSSHLLCAMDSSSENSPPSKRVKHNPHVPRAGKPPLTTEASRFWEARVSEKKPRMNMQFRLLNITWHQERTVEAAIRVDLRKLSGHFAGQNITDKCGQTVLVAAGQPMACYHHASGTFRNILDISGVFSLVVIKLPEFFGEPEDEQAALATTMPNVFYENASMSSHHDMYFVSELVKLH